MQPVITGARAAATRAVGFLAAIVVLLGVSAGAGLAAGGPAGPQPTLLRQMTAPVVGPPAQVSLPLEPVRPEGTLRGASAQLEVGRAALALIDYPWQQLGWDIHFLPGQDGYLGRTLVREQRIELYVRPAQDPMELAATIAHELGHVVDVVALDDAERARWLRLRGVDAATPWWPCDDCSDYATGAGDFAEVFSHWLVGSTFRGELAPPPDVAEFQSLLPLLQEGAVL